MKILAAEPNSTLATLTLLVQQFLHLLTRQSIEQHLWIVELGRVRIHQQDRTEL